MISWQDIPGNKGAFESCLDLLRTGEAVGFVGAGASAGLYPLWSQLIQQLAKAAVVAGADPILEEAWCEMDTLLAAQQIRDELGPGQFAELIRETFGPLQGTDGKRYTQVHAALVQSGIRRFVTTNYDPALTYACRELTNADVHAFHWGEDRAKLWLAGQPLAESEVAILHAHGCYDARDSLVLAAEDYRQVYKEDLYRLLVGQLWTRERLLIVGFSFRDEWLKYIVDQALTVAETRQLSGKRHVAIIGLQRDRIPAASAHRKAIEQQLHLRALFYPVEQDHRALEALLQDICLASSNSRGSAWAPSASLGKPDSLKIWFGQVEAEHRLLGDHFDRPAELRLIEQAWVEVKVLPAHQELGAGSWGDVEGGKLLGRPTTLDKVLDWPIGQPSWNQGCWLLEGPPGSGKTTLLRHLAAQLAQKNAKGRIPVFVSLPQLIETGQDLLTHVTDGLGHTTSAPAVHDALAAAGREGRLLLLLDSFDEIPRERRAAARRLLNQLRTDEAWAFCKLVVSSRPIGRGESLQELPRLDLLPLDEERQREFLETWFRHAGQPSNREAADWTPEGEVQAALSHLTSTRGLRDLSGIPLYLTLLTVLWEQGVQPSGKLADLYNEIFELLLNGKHRSKPKPMPSQRYVREALRGLAFQMTEGDCWAESLPKVEGRLRSMVKLRKRLAEEEDSWADLYTFLDDIHERTQILGPHDGGRGDWRFWHRTFREALTAEQLKEQHKEEGSEALVEWARQLEEGGEGRWAEPMAILSGGIDDADALVLQLGEANPKLAVRAAIFAQGLRPETVRQTLRLTDDLKERAQVFESIPDQLGDPEACLALVELLRQGERNGFDLFWLWWIAEEAGRRWKTESRVADVLAGFFDHIPAPDDAELFRFVESESDGRVPLWQEIPAGEDWIGSLEDEEGRFDREGPRHQIQIVRPFWLGAVPVTNAQYAAFDPSTIPSAEQEANGTLPVLGITWYEAVSFCRWLESLPEFADCGVRLPEEEEWEYACRAGAPTRFWAGNEEDSLAEVGWYEVNSGKRTHRVACKPANPWGLYDLHGNVWEWSISELNAQRYKERSPEAIHVVDPAAPVSDLAVSPRVGRVMRGGSCWYPPRWCRSAFRVGNRPWDVWFGLGFRVLLTFARDRRS